jgi:TonB family protein
MSYFTRVGNLFRPSALDRELDEEIECHLRERAEQNVARGMTPGGAAAEARRRFGSIERTKAGMRAARVASPLSIVMPVLLLLTMSSAVFFGTRERVYDVTGDISAPVPIAGPHVEYTTAAMRQKIQGTLRLECIVGTDGICSRVTVIRSLDKTFGLDDRAVQTLRDMRFRPGLRQGKPVATRIKLDLRFALR